MYDRARPHLKGAGKMAQLAKNCSPEDRVRVPASIWWLTVICNFSSRRPYALFYPPLILHVHGALAYTHAHKTIKFNRN